MKLLAIFVFSLSFFLFSCTTFAAGEFTTDFQSTYEIRLGQPTAVTHNISLTNNLAHIYTTEYTLSLGSTTLADISASDGELSLPIKTQVHEGQTTVTITLVHPQVGQGKTNHLRLSYTDSSIETHSGGSWELNIPRVERANELREYRRVIIVPRSLGQATYTYPDPTHTEKADDTIYTYLGYPQDSLSLLFGQNQSYHLQLTYSIANPNLTSALTEIALPPDTAYQKVLLESLTPEPRSITVDSDGNWLAVYPLKAQEVKSVEVSLYLTVYPLPTFPSASSSTPLGEDPNWPRSPAVTSLAASLTTPQQIYDYLVGNFRYDHARVGGDRLGADQALALPFSATCTEFTDAFIALSRTSGIPAREINGFAYTASPGIRPSGEDILHAWPEYYDQALGQWRQIDPTWGNTTGGTDYFHKLDYGHLAFVVHGSESTYPLPAGAYKSGSTDSTIEVTPVSALPSITPHPLTPNVLASTKPVPPSLWARLLQVVLDFLHIKR